MSDAMIYHGHVIDDTPEDAALDAKLLRQASKAQLMQEKGLDQQLAAEGIKTPYSVDYRDKLQPPGSNTIARPHTP